MEGISDSSRHKIILLLMERDMTPTEISKYFQFTMPAVSVHLPNHTSFLGMLLK
jgi:ArsR family transcriptional regulator, arsenate/arsenite/antimonite-responsive transcriptional repressor